MEDLVSIVIPAYNADKFIGDCLEKLLNQSYKNIEVIVSNDGSTDETLNIVNEYIAKDSRVKCYSQENSGSSVARINGAYKAQGKYILFIDSDDFFVDGAIERLVEVAKKYDTDLVKFRLQTYPALVPQDIIIQGQDRECVITKEEFKDKIYPLFITSYNMNANGTLMVKKDCFRVKDKNAYYKLRFAEDMKLSLELVDNAQSITVITDVLYNYFTNPNSITKSPCIEKILYNLDNFVKVYSKLYEYLEKWNIKNGDNLKIIDKKVIYEVSKFYKKILDSEDREYVNNNKEEIEKIIYSKMVLKAIENLKISDFEKDFRCYDEVIKIYGKEALV